MKQQEYYDVITEQLARQMGEEAQSIERAAACCAKSVQKGRVIHVYGCGHSQMFAMEVFYRPGGWCPSTRC